MYFMRQRGATFRLGEKVVSVGRTTRRTASSRPSRAARRSTATSLLYTVGRQTNADLLNLAGRRALGRRPRPDQGQRALPDGRPAHLRGRRRDRLPGARLDLDGAGTARELPHVRRVLREPARGDPLRHLHDSRDLDGRQDRAGADRRRRCPTRSACREFDELAKGQMLGVEAGLLKLLFDPKTPQAPRRPHLRRARHRDRPHRPGRARLRRHDRLLPRHRLQLPDDGGGVQGGGVGRAESAVGVIRFSGSGQHDLESCRIPVADEDFKLLRGGIFEKSRPDP